jgi:hypothetical protein
LNHKSPANVLPNKPVALKEQPESPSAPVDESLWTANEVRILRDLAKHHAPLAMLSYHIGRTVEDIQQKAASINLPLFPSPKSKRIIRTKRAV